MTEPAPAPVPLERRQRHWRERATVVLAVLLLAWLTVAYLLLPAYWVHYAHRHPAFDALPRITRTGSDLPGDPLNVSLVGTEVELKGVLRAAHCYPADPLGWRSSLAIAEATILHRPYADAPVSSLYLFGRKEDLAYERPVGRDPRRRHHVRFWGTGQAYDDGRPVWVGAATYDRSVGFSHTTGQITHHIAADIDAERDGLFHDLEQTGRLTEVFFVNDFHPVHVGRNGGGDPWFTDGRLEAGVIAAAPGP